jgi:carboxylesterase
METKEDQLSSESIWLTSDSGKGSVLLFHGLTGTPQQMSELASILNSAGYNVSAPLIPGHGTTVGNLKNISSTEWLKFARDSFDAVEGKFGGPIFVMGISFGGVLAAYLGTVRSEKIKKLVLLATSFKFNSRKREILIRILGMLPDALLNKLGTRQKKQREEGYLVKKYFSYTEHSIASVVRLYQMRKLALGNLSRIVCPVMIIQDPNDHHLSPEVPTIIADRVSSKEVVISWQPEGRHQLLHGKCSEEVIKEIFKFITNA